MLYRALCDKVCQWLAAGRLFSTGTPVSSTNKTDRHDITEILLKVVLNTINTKFCHSAFYFWFKVWQMSNNNYIFDCQCSWQYMFVLYFHRLEIYSLTLDLIGRDIFLLLKITQIWVITNCVVLDHSTVIFQKEKKGGWVLNKKKSTGMQDSNSQDRQ